MIQATPQRSTAERAKDDDCRPGVAIGSRLRLYLDCEYDISACESLPDVLAVIEQDAALKYYPERKALWLLNELKTRGLNLGWLDGFKSGLSRKLKRDYPCEASDYHTWLMPYSHVVTDEQFLQALTGGLTVLECHNRLLNAECLLYKPYSEDAWQQGWLDAVDAITWLTTPENSDELGIADLLEIADDKRQELRRRCYSTALATGSPELDEIQYSSNGGRCDCLDAGMMFVLDEDNEWSEIADILRKTTDRQELRELVVRQQAIHTNQMLRSIWTPFGYVRHDQIGSI